MKKAGKVLGILGGIILFYLAISMVSFLFADLFLAITGIFGIAGAVAAIVGNSFVESKRLKQIMLIGAPCTSLLALGAIVIPSVISGSIKNANSITLVILGVMLLTFIMLTLSAAFGLKRQEE